MKKGQILFCLVIFSAFFLVCNAAAQTIPDLHNGDLVESNSINDYNKSNLSINFSYNENGKISKITIESNKDIETNSTEVINYQRMMKIIEHFVPLNTRGKKKRQSDTDFGRGFIRSFYYENTSINLTVVCKDDNCGVSYVEIHYR